MNLDISTSIAFVKERTEKTAAVQTVLAKPENGGWVWALKPPAAWTEDLRQLDGAADGTPAQKAVYSLGVMARKGAALEARYKTLHTLTLQAVGVMRARALANAELRAVVDELSARGDSHRAIEEEGDELLAAWKEEFGTDFVPAPGNTYAAFKALFEGTPSPDGGVTPEVPSLRTLKREFKEARAVARRGAGVLNGLISRLEDDCVRWYAEATAVFPVGTDNGDLIRSEVPTDYTPAKPAAAAPAAANPVAPAGGNAGPG